MTNENAATTFADAPVAAPIPEQSVDSAIALQDDELSDVCLTYAGGGIIVVCRHDPLG